MKPTLLTGPLRQLLRRRVWLLVAVHLIVFTLSYESALRLRFDWTVPTSEREVFWKLLPWLLALKLLIFHRFRSLHGWWRYVTFEDLAALLRVATVSSLVIASVDHFLLEHYQVPRSILLIDWALTIILLGGLRSMGRMGREVVWPALNSQERRPALMIGADEGAEGLTRQIHNHPKLNYRVVGFLHDNPDHHGSRLGGIPFLGSPDHAVSLAVHHNVRDILVLARSLPGRRLRQLAEQCRRMHLNLKMIPAVDELLQSSYRWQVRDVDIHDLLRRGPVQLDSAAIRAMLADSTVLVTGAGGSIGSELCRQVLQCRPKRLVLVERAENSLFHVERELRECADGASIAAHVADIGDWQRIHELFRRHKPTIVFHAAAHKHVPLMENNPGEAIKNNVLGTMLLADTADKYGVERFVFISTDKAVNPTSVMGVTKHLAERYVHACSESSITRFMVVRFGNVLGSAGSVVPIFQEQIRRGGPVTVTHPDMKRFFMTIPEASQLVLQAAAMGNGGEIFVLDMGEPVKILDLARDLIRLSGYSSNDIEIEITGIRPGEKLYEELYLKDEETIATAHPKLRMAYHRPCSRTEIVDALRGLATLVDAPDDVIREKLCELAPDYQPGLTVGVQAAETMREPVGGLALES